MKAEEQQEHVAVSVDDVGVGVVVVDRTANATTAVHDDDDGQQQHSSSIPSSAENSDSDDDGGATDDELDADDDDLTDEELAAQELDDETLSNADKQLELLNAVVDSLPSSAERAAIQDLVERLEARIESIRFRQRWERVPAVALRMLALISRGWPQLAVPIPSRRRRSAPSASTAASATGASTSANGTSSSSSSSTSMQAAIKAWKSALAPWKRRLRQAKLTAGRKLQAAHRAAAAAASSASAAASAAASSLASLSSSSSQSLLPSPASSPSSHGSVSHRAALSLLSSHSASPGVPTPEERVAQAYACLGLVALAHGDAGTALRHSAVALSFSRKQPDALYLAAMVELTLIDDMEWSVSRLRAEAASSVADRVTTTAAATTNTTNANAADTAANASTLNSSRARRGRTALLQSETERAACERAIQYLNLITWEPHRAFWTSKGVREALPYRFRHLVDVILTRAKLHELLGAYSSAADEYAQVWPLVGSLGVPADLESKVVCAVASMPRALLLAGRSEASLNAVRSFLIESPRQFPAHCWPEIRHRFASLLLHARAPVDFEPMSGNTPLAKPTSLATEALMILLLNARVLTIAPDSLSPTPHIRLPMSTPMSNSQQSQQQSQQQQQQQQQRVKSILSIDLCSSHATRESDLACLERDTCLLFARQNDYVVVSEMYRNMLSSQLENASLWYKLALALMSAHQYQEAFLAVSESIQRDPNCVVALLMAAKLCLNHLGKLKEAVSFAWRALDILQTTSPDVEPSFSSPLDPLHARPAASPVSYSSQLKPPATAGGSRESAKFHFSNVAASTTASTSTASTTATHHSHSHQQQQHLQQHQQHPQQQSSSSAHARFPFGARAAPAVQITTPAQNLTLLSPAVHASLLLSARLAFGLACSKYAYRVSTYSNRKLLQKRALAALQDAYVVCPTSHKLLFALATLNADIREITTALGFVKKALALNHSHVPSWALLALLLSSQKKYAEAIRACENGMAQASGPKPVTLMLMHARLLSHTGDFFGAVRAFDELVSVLFEPSAFQYAECANGKARCPVFHVHSLTPRTGSDGIASAGAAAAVARSNRGGLALSDSMCAQWEISSVAGFAMHVLIGLSQLYARFSLQLTDDNLLPYAFDCVFKAREISASSRLPDIHAQLAALYVQQGAIADAVHHYESALALEANHSESLVGLGSLYHDPEAAVRMALAAVPVGAVGGAPSTSAMQAIVSADSSTGHAGAGGGGVGGVGVIASSSALPSSASSSFVVPPLAPAPSALSLLGAPALSSSSKSAAATAAASATPAAMLASATAAVSAARHAFSPNLVLAYGYLTSALTRDASNHRAWYELGLVLTKQGKSTQSLDHLLTSVELERTAPILSFVHVHRAC